MWVGLKNISTLDFSTPSKLQSQTLRGLFNPGLFKHELSNSGFFNPRIGVEKFMVENVLQPPTQYVECYFTIFYKGHFMSKFIFQVNIVHLTSPKITRLYNMDFCFTILSLKYVLYPVKYTPG